uniref:Integrase catalytic domain-containing protein n=1 Tax=Strongyloides papillosus TaxID=174720 RepID=A0A0N5BVJ1_STREA
MDYEVNPATLCHVFLRRLVTTFGRPKILLADLQPSFNAKRYAKFINNLAIRLVINKAEGNRGTGTLIKRVSRNLTESLAKMNIMAKKIFLKQNSLFFGDSITGFWPK